MEPRAFIPEGVVKDFLSRTSVRATRNGVGVEHGTVYNLPDGRIIMLDNLFRHNLDYGYAKKGMLASHKVVLEIEIAAPLNWKIAAVFKQRKKDEDGRTVKGGPIGKLGNKSEKSGCLLFRKSIPFRISQDHHGSFSWSPENCVRLLATVNGYLYHFEVALVAQVWTKPVAYAVTIQLTRHGYCHEEDGRVGFYPFDEWPEMLEVITNLVGDDIVFLPDRDEVARAYSESTHIRKRFERVATTLPPKTAVAEWWSYALQTGCATAEGKSRKIFAEEMKRPDSPLAFALADELIAYEGIERTRASNTKFEHQLIGCRVIGPAEIDEN